MNCNILVFLSFFCVIEGYKNYEVEEMYYWRDVHYEGLPLDDNTLIGKYPYHIPSNTDVLGVGYHANSGLMLTTVGRIRAGVPSTLNAFCVADYEKGSSPHIWGFPDYEKNTLKAYYYDDSSAYYARNLSRKGGGYSPGYYHSYSSYDFTIISVYHPNVDDHCNRLYVVDTGVLSYGVSEVYNVQYPAIIVFDLPSNGCQTREFPVIRRIEIPISFWKDPVGFVFIAIDHQVKKSCDDVFLYITNTFDSSLTVYDYKKGSFWAFSDPSMGPIIAESKMVFNNYFDYEFVLGIMNVALGWQDKKGNRNAYFAPGASIAENVVSTKVLKSFPKAPYKYNFEDFFQIGYRGCKSQTFKQTFDLSTGVIFFAEMQSNQVRCWNTNLPLNPDTIGVVYESEALAFISEIFVDFDGYLWFHSCHLPLTFLSDIALDMTNFTLTTFRIKVSEAIKGTVCDLY